MKKIFAFILSLGLIISPIPAVNTAHAASGGYLKVILGMANGIVGSTILTKCAMGSAQPSILVYFAGSLVFVAAEIAGGKEKDKDTKDNSNTLDQIRANMTEGGDYQKAAIEMQIKNEEDNLKHIQKKIRWMNATRVVYTIAAVLAFIEWWMSLPYPVGINKPDAGACSPNQALNIPMASAISFAYVVAQGYAGSGTQGAVMAGAMQLLAPQIEKLASKLFEEVSIGSSIQEMTVSMLNSALGRVAFFGAAALIVTQLVSELQKEEKASKDKIAKLREVLKTLGGMENAIAEGDSTPDANLNEGDSDPSSLEYFQKKYGLKALPESKPIGKHCFASSSQGASYSEESCKSSVKIAKPSINAQFEVPTITAGANTSIDMAQAIADGDLAKADVEATKLASMAGKIDKIYEDLMKKTNDELKKQGKKPIDIQAEADRQLAALETALKKEAGKGGAATGSNLAVIGNSEVGHAEVSAATPVNGAGEINPTSVENKNVVEAPNGSAPDFAAMEAAANAASEGDPLADELYGNDPSGSKSASLSDRLNEFDENVNDINNDRDVSIFKQVSNRYFLNYTKLFNRKKVDPPMAEEELPVPAN